MDHCEKNQLFPATVTAGLSFAVIISTPSAPAPSWIETLYLRGPASIDLTATAIDDAHEFVASSDATALWTPGRYWWKLRAQSSAEVREVANGEIEILPDFAALPAGYDGRTPNEIALDAITAVLAKRATQDQQRYTIGDRELWRSSPADLLKLKAFYSAAVRRERAAASGRRKFGRAIPVRFFN